MNRRIRISFLSMGSLLVLAGSLPAQLADDPEQRSLTRLKNFAVHAQVQVSRRVKLERIDESEIRRTLEQAMRREGISVQGSGDVRDGSQAQISLTYLVLETGTVDGAIAGFAASSCLQAHQLVTIPRLSKGRITYVVAPTWSSCGMLIGGKDSYRGAIMRNAEEQIGRFLHDWRAVNPIRFRIPGGYRTTPRFG